MGGDKCKQTLADFVYWSEFIETASLKLMTGKCNNFHVLAIGGGGGGGGMVVMG